MKVPAILVALAILVPWLILWWIVMDSVWEVHVQPRLEYRIRRMYVRDRIRIYEKHYGEITQDEIDAIWDDAYDLTDKDE